MKKYNYTIEKIKFKSSLKRNHALRGSLPGGLLSLIIGSLIVAGIAVSLLAQDQYSVPSWWFGAAAGGNINFYDGPPNN